MLCSRVWGSYGRCGESLLLILRSMPFIFVILFLKREVYVFFIHGMVFLLLVLVVEKRLAFLL